MGKIWPEERKWKLGAKLNLRPMYPDSQLRPLMPHHTSAEDWVYGSQVAKEKGGKRKEKKVPSKETNSLWILLLCYWRRRIQGTSYCSSKCLNFKSLSLRDFPGGAVVGNQPANVRDTGSSPGPGRSHMPRSNWARAPQLPSLRARAREPQLLSPWATTTEPASHNYEAHVPRAHAPQQEKPLQWKACTLQRRVAPARRN